MEYSMNRALEIALYAHEDQRDKAGKTYIIHPVRVMKNVQTDREKIVALLHDVVEDSDVSFEELEKDFSEEIIEAVKCLTKREDQSYDHYIENIRENPIAREVKKADLRDNLDIERLNKLTEDDFKRLKKYHKSLEKLKN